MKIAADLVLSYISMGMLFGGFVDVNLLDNFRSADAEVRLGVSLELTG
jgi:hypothetical protein